MCVEAQLRKEIVLLFLGEFFLSSLAFIEVKLTLCETFFFNPAGIA